MTVRILVGDVRDKLAEMPDESVHCVVTSPPYWGLRDYGIPPQVWGGDPDCAHEFAREVVKTEIGGGNWAQAVNGRGEAQGDVAEFREPQRSQAERGFCRHCDAWLGCLGLEPDYRLYVMHTVQVFRAVWRVLRPDGTLWLNLGDCYATGAGVVGTRPGGGLQGDRWAGYRGEHNAEHAGKAASRVAAMGPMTQPNRLPQPGLKAKDLVGIPWRVALALQDDGWWLRQDIIWAKPNPMPESVRDRPTRAHEYLFLLARSEHYFYDAEAIAEPVAPASVARVNQASFDAQTGGDKDYANGTAPNRSARRALENFARGRKFDNRKPYAPGQVDARGSGHDRGGGGERSNGLREPWMRNKRSVWNVACKPFKEAHFACVDADTEALTPDGWRDHEDLQDGDLIAAYDQQSGILFWQPATFHRYPFGGELVTIEKRDASQRLTPNHRCLVRRRIGGEAVVEARELKPSMQIPTTGLLRVDESAGPGTDFAALLGWYLTEGEKRRHHIIRINQSIAANPAKVDAIRGILGRLGANYTEAVRKREWRGRPADMVVFSVRGEIAERLHDYSPAKAISLAWLAWPRADIEALLDAIIDGDGHRRDDGRCCIVRKDRQFIDAIQILGLRLGKNVAISARKEGGFAAYLTDRSWLTLRSADGRHIPLGTVLYEGTVWCPSVLGGFWLARRRGRTFVTGNTFPPGLIVDCIRAGAPNGGVVLDPFGGAGTTGLVADRLGRDAILIELNPEYAEMARQRIERDAGLFAECGDA